MIYVVLHKPNWYPKMGFYSAIKVGSNKFDNDLMFNDSTGDNISLKNPNYSELTAIYWLWKNKLDDAIGIVHYRRFFVNRIMISLRNIEKKILSETYIREALENHDVIVPFSSYSNYSLYDEYNKAHYISDLEHVKKIIESKHPDYIDSFHHVIYSKQNSHRFFANMFISKKDFFDDYSEWLFDILFELEKKIDIRNCDAYQARVFGFISERLFNVYLHYNKSVFREEFVINIEATLTNRIKVFLLVWISKIGIYFPVKTVANFIRRIFNSV